MLLSKPFFSITLFSCSLSTISSLLIIYIVLRSDARLSTTYHRLIFFMSCFDLLGSISGALTTLPMPRNEPDGVTYDFEAPRLGNEFSCEVQAFTIRLGLFTSYSYVGSLFFFYACSIGLGVNERTTLKFVEPAIHLFPFFIGVGMSIPPWLMDLYNPSSLGSWCTAVATGCNFETQECVRGNLDDARLFSAFSVLLMVLLFATMIASFGLVLGKAFAVERQINELCQMHRTMLSWGDERIQNNREHFKVLFVQACSYTLPLVLAILFQAIESANVGYNAYQRPSVINYLRVLFFPSQGFWNLFTFIGHKIHNYRKIHKDVTNLETLRLLLAGTASEPMFLSGLSLVRFDLKDKSDQMLVGVQDDEGYFSYSVSKIDGVVQNEEAPFEDDSVGLSYPTQFTGHQSFGNMNLHDGSYLSRGDLSGFDSKLENSEHEVVSGSTKSTQ